MNFDKSLLSRNFFRFTGPPENWLTAIKFMTWGLEEKYRERWANIQPGDIFFMHSTLSGSKFKNTKSSIIGLGVVGSNFTVKDSYLWVEEFDKKENIWPLLVPFSEIYLFSDLPDSANWNSPSSENQDETQGLINSLLSNGVPLSSVNGFPQMGSFSSVSQNVVEQIFNNNSNLYLLESNQDIAKETRTTPFIEIKDASESLRYAETLQSFDTVTRRVVNKNKSTYTKDNELLARAEDSHANTLEELIKFFRSKNYETYQNRHVDLFAANGEQSFLVEVKSTENNNFKSQARKGIVQLFEYEYFEVDKFISDKNITKNNHKILVPSQRPVDNDYISFINYLDTDVGIIQNHLLEAVGKSIGIHKI